MRTVKIKLAKHDAYYPDRKFFDCKIMRERKDGKVEFISEEDIKACEASWHDNDTAFYLLMESRKELRSKK